MLVVRIAYLQANNICCYIVSSPPQRASRLLACTFFFLDFDQVRRFDGTESNAGEIDRPRVQRLSSTESDRLRRWRPPEERDPWHLTDRAGC